MATQTGPQSAPWRVHVGAFGKHPGWDDHIEDLGIETDRLVQVRRALYSEGIAGNIDAGAWEKLDEDKRLPVFDHIFYWRERDQLVIGRFWSSRDGKGRTKYPMAVCVHAPGAPDEWLFDVVVPRLGAVRDACIAAPNAEGVRAVLERWKASLQEAATPPPAGSSKSGHEAMFLRRLLAAGIPADAPADDPTLGLTRILYEIDRELAPFKPAPGRSRSTGVTGVGSHLRVPRVLAEPGEGARAWLALMRQELTPIAPVLIIDPIGHPFLDVIVGDVEPSLLFCVRAGPGAVPPANTVPYTIAPEFAAGARDKIAAWTTGQQPAPAPAASRPTVELAAPAVANLKQWLVPIIGVVLVIIGVLAMIMLSRGGGGGGGGNGVKNDTSPKQEVQTHQQPAQTPAVTPPTPPPAAPTPEATPPTRTAEAPPAPPAAQPRQPAANGTPEPAGDITRDPRLDWAAAEEFALLIAHLDRADAALAQEGAPPLAQIRTEIAQERGSVDLLLAQPWSGGNRATIVPNVNNAKAALAQFRAQIDQALAQQILRLKDQSAGVLSRAQVEHPALREAISAAAGSIDTSLGWSATLQKANAVATIAADADARWRAITAPAAVRGMNAAATDLRVQERSSALLASVASGAVAADREKVDASLDLWRRWCQNATELTRQVAGLDEALRNGKAASDAASQDRAAQLAASAEELGLGDAVRPTVDRYRRLAAIRAEHSTDALARAVKASGEQRADDGPSHTLLAWSRLAELDWPANATDLAAAGAWHRDAIAPAVASIVAEDLRGEAQRAVTQASVRMWTGFLARQSHVPGAVAAARAQRESLGVPAGAMADLPAHTAYNIALTDLRDELAPLLQQADRQALAQTRARVRAFVEATSGAAFEQARAFRAKATELVERAPVVDLASLGPGAVGWSASILSDSELAFTSPADPAVTLAFRRVARPDGKAAYLATEELSVAALRAILAASGKAEELRAALFASAAETNDRRDGPRTWVWSDRPGSEGVVSSANPADPTLGWLRPNAEIRAGYYASPPSPPSVAHPATHVSPIAALTIARLAGCRLPTKEEWGAGFESGGAAGASGANLRDRTWATHAAHISLLRDASGTAAAPLPTEGAFWPQGPEALTWAQEREAVHPTDDGVLWFMPVQAGEGEFKHMVGNVAEYVYDDADRSDQAPADPVRITEIFGRQGQGLFVIGGSALTARQIQATSPEPVRWSRSRASGFSDVGVRLAFTAAGADRPAVTTQEWAELVSGAETVPP